MKINQIEKVFVLRLLWKDYRMMFDTFQSYENYSNVEKKKKKRKYDQTDVEGMRANI